MKGTWRIRGVAERGTIEGVEFQTGNLFVGDSFVYRDCHKLLQRLMLVPLCNYFVNRETYDYGNSFAYE